MIPLSDYLGFIFSEITRAREIADRTSAQIAKVYSEDPVMKFFSVPRFKIPEMALSIPVLISGAKFATVLKFKMELKDFSAFISAEIDHAVNTLKLQKIRTNVIKPGDIIVVRPPGGLVLTTRPSKAKQQLQPLAALKDSEIAPFYALLSNNPDPGRPENIVELEYSKLFNDRFKIENLVEDYKKFYPRNELFLGSLKLVLEFVTKNTVVEKTRIENLLVSPETNIVKNESNQFSVFTINAKINEDGVFVKSIKDKDGNVKSVEVEFE